MNAVRTDGNTNVRHDVVVHPAALPVVSASMEIMLAMRHRRKMGHRWK